MKHKVNASWKQACNARLVVAICCALAINGGCSKKKLTDKDYSAQVFGTVRLDGKPLKSGTVTFVPLVGEENGGRPGLARIGSDGNYRIGNADRKGRGLLPGKYKVTVLKMDLPPAVDAAAQPTLAIPERYVEVKMTPLEYTVAPGENPIDLDLTTAAENG